MDVTEPGSSGPAATAEAARRDAHGGSTGHVAHALVTVEEHLATILDAVTPVPTRLLPLAEAFGATLAAPARARIDLPAFDNSAMDGFAVHHRDVAAASAAAPARLRVVADLPAGTSDDPAFAAGEAVRIMTGSPLPSAADTIVPFEDTAGGLADSLGEIAVTCAPHAVGAHVRRRGEDTRRGDVVLASGTLLGPLQVGALAAVGITEVEVARPPRVVIVSTGSELVPVERLAGDGAGGEVTGSAEAANRDPHDLQLAHGRIPESNGILLAGLVTAAGARVVHREIVDDEGSALRDLLARVTAGPDAADVVVFTGGVSAGAYEVVRQTVAQMTFRKVAMQPGKPQGFGVAGRTLLFGLPGNPVSAAVSFEVFVRPALLALQGRAPSGRPVVRLAAASAWRTPPGRRQYLPVTIDRTEPAAWRAVPASSGGSHLAGRLGGAEGYAVVPADVDAVAAGDPVDVILID